MILPRRYLDTLSHYTVDDVGEGKDLHKTVFKLYFKSWYKPRKKIEFYWSVVSDGSKQCRSLEAEELSRNLVTYFSNR